MGTELGEPRFTCAARSESGSGEHVGGSGGHGAQNRPGEDDWGTPPSAPPAPPTIPSLGPYLDGLVGVPPRQRPPHQLAVQILHGAAAAGRPRRFLAAGGGGGDAGALGQVEVGRVEAVPVHVAGEGGGRASGGGQPRSESQQQHQEPQHQEPQPPLRSPRHLPRAALAARGGGAAASLPAPVPHCAPRRRARATSAPAAGRGRPRPPRTASGGPGPVRSPLPKPGAGLALRTAPNCREERLNGVKGFLFSSYFLFLFPPRQEGKEKKKEE